MKKELKHRENSWAKVKWEMVGPINKIRTLQGRLVCCPTCHFCFSCFELFLSLGKGRNALCFCHLVVEEENIMRFQSALYTYWFDLKSYIVSRNLS